jgi:hypothetical protein
VPPGANPLGGVQFVSAAPETLQDQLGITPYDAEAAPDDRDLSNIMRGIALDPLATSGMRKHLNLFRQQFFEASATATAIAANDGIRDGESARVEGLSLDGTPLAYQLSGGRMRYSGPLGDKDEQKLETVQGSLGVELSPALNLAVMASHWRRTDKFQNLIDETYGVPPVQIWKVNNRQSVSERSNSLYLLAAHQFTDRATLMAGGGYLETRLAMDRHETTSLTYLDLGFEFVGDFKFDRVVQSKTIFGTAAAQVELGPWVVTAGGDYERRTGSRKLMIDDIEPQMDHGRGETDRFFLSTSGRPLDPLQIDGFIALRDGQVEGGAGLRLEVSERQSFAAAYSSEIVTSLPFSLGPMTLAGLVPNSAPAAIGTRSKSIMGRWAAEWSNWLFTSVDVQHQNHDFLLAPAVRAFQSPTAAIDVTLRPPWVEVGARDIDRATITSNILLSRTLAIDVVGAIARSDNHAFLAKKYGKAEARWTSPIGVRASLAVTFLGKRVQHDGAFDLPLDKALWTDFTLNWRSPGRCWEVDLRLYNITNSNIDMYENYPRFRRTIALSLTTRL